MTATALTPVEFADSELLDALLDANPDGNLVNSYTGKQWLEFENSGVAPRTVTLNSIVPSNYGTDVNLAVVIAAGARKKVKLPPPATRWRNTSGALELSYDDATDLKVGVFKWPE